MSTISHEDKIKTIVELRKVTGVGFTYAKSLLELFDFDLQKAISATSKEIFFLSGGKVPNERIEKVITNGPRSPAFYVHLEDWKEDRNIYSQITGTEV